MKKILFSLLISIVIPTIVAQNKIDTIYYNKEGRGVPDKAFADYYRVTLIPSDSNYVSMFRDFYNSGRIKGEGQFISIDRYEDSKSVFNGEVKSYYENGLIKTHTFFDRGVKNGIMTVFSEDGTTYSQLEFKQGEPTTDYYLVSNENGYTSKFSLQDDSPIWESPNVDEKKTRYDKGTSWPYYIKNGVYVSMTLSVVKDYGKYYRVDLVMSNNTMGPIDFEPNDIQAILTDKNDQRWYLGVFPAEQYMKTVRRRQNFAMAMYGIAQGMAAAGAGYSYATTTSNSYYSGSAYGSAHASVYGTGGYAYGNAYGSSSYSGRSTTTTTTQAYNGAAAYQASVIAGEQIAAFDESMLAEREAKDRGYLKLTTIEPGETITGYVLIEKKKGPSLNIIVDIYGAKYEFPWTLM